MKMIKLRGENYRNEKMYLEDAVDQLEKNSPHSIDVHKSILVIDEKIAKLEKEQDDLLELPNLQLKRNAFETKEYSFDILALASGEQMRLPAGKSSTYNDSISEYSSQTSKSTTPILNIETPSSSNRTSFRKSIITILKFKTKPVRKTSHISSQTKKKTQAQNHKASPNITPRSLPLIRDTISVSDTVVSCSTKFGFQPKTLFNP